MNKCEVKNRRMILKNGRMTSENESESLRIDENEERTNDETGECTNDKSEKRRMVRMIYGRMTSEKRRMSEICTNDEKECLNDESEERTNEASEERSNEQ